MTAPNYTLLPRDQWNHVVADGTTEKSIVGVDAEDVAIVTTGLEFQAVYIPEGVEFKKGVIQLVKETGRTSYHPEDDGSCFEWSNNVDGSGGTLWDYYGKPITIAKAEGGLLGYIKAPAGYKVSILGVA